EPECVPLAERGGERFFPDVERFLELPLRDDEGYEDADAVRIDARLEQQEPSLRGGFHDGRRYLRCRVLRAAAVHELVCEHRPEPADVADGVPALLPRQHAAPDGLADLARCRAEALVLEDVEDRQSG